MLLPGYDSDNSCDVYNLLEFFIWLIIGLIMLIYAIKTPAGRKRQLYAIFTVAFILFGVSDLVEISTDAWWRPWWLLLWNGFCVLIFVVCGYRIWKIDRDCHADK